MYLKDYLTDATYFNLPTLPTLSLDECQANKECQSNILHDPYQNTISQA